MHSPKKLLQRTTGTGHRGRRAVLGKVGTGHHAGRQQLWRARFRRESCNRIRRDDSRKGRGEPYNAREMASSMSSRAPIGTVVYFEHPFSAHSLAYSPRVVIRLFSRANDSVARTIGDRLATLAQHDVIAINSHDGNRKGTCDECCCDVAGDGCFHVLRYLGGVDYRTHRGRCHIWRFALHRVREKGIGLNLSTARRHKQMQRMPSHYKTDRTVL